MFPEWSEEVKIFQDRDYNQKKKWQECEECGW